MKFADLADQPLFVSFSGGRTSGYMTHWLLTHYDPAKCVVLFANTGREHPETLDFIHRCDQEFGFGTVWLEAVVHHGARAGTTCRVVTFETASREGEPFEEQIKKYGIPNVAFPQCTRELKLRPMYSYLRSIGLDPKRTPTAIGIRADERRRVKGQPNVLYPLVEFGIEKPDVLDWWSRQTFDLGIEEFEGNCRACFKKSFAKHFAQIDKDPTAYDFPRRMETLYRHVGPQAGERVFFRGNRSTEQLFQLRRSAPGYDPRHMTDGGCSESCELYEFEDFAGPDLGD